MFGYVRVYRPDLRVRELDTYEATYCGLCHAMGKCTGNCSRLSLSYDFAFLALVRTLLSGKERPTAEKRACLLHPFRKRPAMPTDGTMRQTVGASVLLTYRKLLDDRRDETGKKKFRAMISLPYYRSKRKKLLRRNPLWQKEDEAISALLDEFSAKENAAKDYLSDPQNNAPVFADDLTALSGKLLAAVFTGDAEEALGENEKKIAAALGDALGRYVYLADALDDYAEDVRKGRFNPLRLLYGNEMSEEERLSVCDAIRLHLSEAVPALDLLPDTDADRKRVVENVFYLGLTAPLRDGFRPTTAKSTRKDKKNEHDRSV